MTNKLLIALLLTMMTAPAVADGMLPPWLRLTPADNQATGTASATITTPDGTTSVTTSGGSVDIHTPNGSVHASVSTGPNGTVSSSSGSVSVHTSNGTASASTSGSSSAHAGHL